MMEKTLEELRDHTLLVFRDLSGYEDAVGMYTLHQMRDEIQIMFLYTSESNVTERMDYTIDRFWLEKDWDAALADFKTRVESDFKE